MLFIDFPDFGECSFIPPCGHGVGVNGQATNVISTNTVWICPTCGLKIEADMEIGLNPHEMLVTFPDGNTELAYGYEW